MNILIKDDLAYAPEDLIQFMDRISKRGNWKEIPLAILHEIAKNSKGKYDEVYSFVQISEATNLLNDKTIPACKNHQSSVPTPIVFGITFCMEGINITRQFYEIARIVPKDGEAISRAGRIGDMLFMASFLCDPF